MAQYEYQVVEQAGGRVSHLNERIMALVEDGFHPIMMTGTAPQVSIMLRRATTPAAQAPQAQAQTAQAAPSAAPTRPAQ